MARRACPAAAGERTIAADGEAHYRFQSARGRPAIERRRRLSPADLEPLRRATSDPAFCQEVAAARTARDAVRAIIDRMKRD